MKRIVVDTNVLVSGLLFGGVPGGVVALWQKGKVRPLCSKEIIEEYLRVLAYPKFRLGEPEIEFILTHEILPYFEVIAVPPGKPMVAADPADDKFIWCALAGGATAIVSGDEHLLKLKDSPVPVLSAAEFLRNEGALQF
jgi:putative PIN family toxin of toxin-antitoxin system